jgi:hypothetical protein
MNNLISENSISLDEITLSILSDMGKSTLHDYVYIYNWVIDAYKKFRQDYSFEVSTIEVKTPQDGTIRFPDDYVSLSKIGVRNGDRIDVIMPDTTLSLFKDSKYKPSDPYRPLFTKFWGIRDQYGYALDSVYYGEYIFGNRRNYNGYYTEDRACREFKFSNEVHDKNVLIEYISSGINADTDTVVPIYAEESLKSYVDWKKSKSKYGKSSVEAKACKEEYLTELRIMRRRMDKSLDMDTLLYLTNKFVDYRPR